MSEDKDRIGEDWTAGCLAGNKYAVYKGGGEVIGNRPNMIEKE